jgi:hypothetical protein
LRGLAFIFSIIYKILIALSAFYLILTLRRYAFIIKLIKPNIRYITRFITISYIYFKVRICYTIKGVYKEVKLKYYKVSDY